MTTTECAEGATVSARGLGGTRDVSRRPDRERGVAQFAEAGHHVTWTNQGSCTIGDGASMKTDVCPKAFVYPKTAQRERRRAHTGSGVFAVDENRRLSKSICDILCIRNHQDACLVETTLTAGPGS